LGEERPFSLTDLNLLSAFAAQAAVAIENASLYGQVISHADNLETEIVERTRDLAISESKYRSLVESAVAGIFQTDLDAKITYINLSFSNILGYEPEELVGRSVLEIMPPDLAGKVLQRYENPEGLTDPGEQVYETAFLSKNDRRISALAAISLITDDQGRNQGVTIQAFDISERKSLESALQGQRDRLHAILANIGDAVFVMDPEGRIEFVNPAWERLNGYTQQEAIGETPGIMKSGHHTREFYDEMWQTILSGRTWSGEVVNRRKDGSNYDAVVTVQSISDENGQVINLVGVQHDISALKQVDRLKSQFVSDVSHELRTPLTNIRLYLDLMHSTEDKDKLQSYLDTLIRESERLANLINDLLSLSRLEAGATPFYPQPIDLEDLLKPLVEDRASMAAARGLELKLELSEAVPLAQADPKLLGQVFTNLLTNAMHYTPEGGKINVRTALERIGNTEWVVASFEDTGVGVRPEEQPLIFDRFYRGYSGEVTTITGTGLGLSICKEIIDLHNGRISVQSEGIPGEGSTFKVCLPPSRE
jgi:PAS domain S-box-containing protein